MSLRILSFLSLLLIPSFLLASDVLLREDAAGVTVSFHLSKQAEKALLSGKAAEGYIPYGSAGYPAIFARLIRVAIPPGSAPSLKLVGQDSSKVSSSIHRWEPAAPVAALSSIYPSSSVILSPVKVIRDVSYVDVLVFPIQVDSDHRRLQVHRSLQFAVKFSNKLVSGYGKRQVRPGFDRLFANSWQEKTSMAVKVAPGPSWQPPNHTGQVYKLKIRKNGVYKLDQSFLGSNTTWFSGSFDPRNIRMFNQGNEVPIYISGEQDGVFDSGDAIYFYGTAYAGENQAGVWNKGDWTDDNVYWLLIGDQNGSRMATRDVAPVSGFTVPATFSSTVHFEQNPLFSPFNTQPDASTWLWLNAYWIGSDGSHASQNHNVTLPSISSDSSFQASLKFQCRGLSFQSTQPAHHVTLSVNGNQVGTFTFSDYDEATNTFSFSQSLLNGPNTQPLQVRHTVSDPAAFGFGSDVVPSDWFEVTYSRKYEAYNNELTYHSSSGDFEYQIPGYTSSGIFAVDVTSPGNPIRLVNASVTTTTSSQIAFQDTAGGFDYDVAVPTTPVAADIAADVPSNLASIAANTNWILIAPQSWTGDSAIQNLVTLRQSQNLNTAVVAVEDIYDEFNYGIFSPDAIKAFLHYVYDLPAQPQLQFVTLLGDASYDYKNYSGAGNFNLVPSYMVDDPGFAGTFFPYAMHSFDNYYGCYSGNDDVPEFMIGRIPARTLTQMHNALAKIVFYDSGISDHTWLGNNLFIADCQDYFEFEPEQDENAAYVHPTPPEQATKMYFFQPPWNCSTKDADGNLLADALEAINSGQAVTSYVGHGGFTQLGALNILQNSDASKFTNTAKPTVLINADCFTGAFYHATVPSSLMEAFMDVSAGIASGIAPGTFMFGFQQSYINGTFYSDTFGIGKLRNLGALYQHIYANLDASGDTRLTQGVVEFGDPASNLAVPAPEAPGNLQSSAAGCGTVDLAWDPPASFSGTYNVYRGLSASGPFTLVNGAPVSDVNYSDAPPGGTTYFYYVASMDAESFEGAGSNIVSQFVPAGGLTMTPATLPGGTTGVLYSQSLTADGGTGPYTYSLASGSLPAGITLSLSGLLSGTTAQTGTFDFDVHVEDSSFCGTQSFSLTISAPACVFCDDFNDTVLSPSWTYKKGTWTEPGGFLQGVFIKKATAIATPAFVGCASCAVEADMKIAASAGKIYLMGWYQDTKNHTELRMDPVNDYWLLKQLGAGTAKKLKFKTPVNAGTSYHAKITFDGANFKVYIDDVLIITMSKIAGTTPSGTVGFVVKAATGLFDSITVN